MSVSSVGTRAHVPAIAPASANGPVATAARTEASGPLVLTRSEKAGSVHPALAASYGNPERQKASHRWGSPDPSWRPAVRSQRCYARPVAPAESCLGRDTGKPRSPYDSPPWYGPFRQQSRGVGRVSRFECDCIPGGQRITEGGEITTLLGGGQTPPDGAAVLTRLPARDCPRRDTLVARKR